MSQPLLTIAIPTCNRAQHLSLLLEVLAVELDGLWHEVELLVYDNASTDDTPNVTSAFVQRWPNTLVVRHATNIGSAPNFLACLGAAAGQYFWLMGDDDAPIKGLLPRVIQLLQREEPDMLYLESLWSSDIEPLLGQYKAGELQARRMGRNAFARRTYIYLTFISSIVVNLRRLRSQSDLEQEAKDLGSYFVQLAWTLGALRSGERFLVVDQPCILATEGDTGGYGAIGVFGSEFPKAVGRVLGTGRTARIILRGFMMRFFPDLIWLARQGRSRNAFTPERPWPAVRHQLSHSPLFWLIIAPIGMLPLPLAQPFYQSWRIFHFLDRRLRGAIRTHRHAIAAEPDSQGVTENS